MTTQLRRIAITVDEPEPGKFYWLLVESREDASVWEALAAADEPSATWGDAFDAGCVALCKLVPDERVGPRAVGENEDADPVG
ncbi:hypothetical protein [Variovorax sp. GT1P44]|uniref:hypothetical protein n=1 Tax=Variovorax sp. GT1P44 TaxID=3443742 RepID=UPI003F457B0D